MRLNDINFYLDFNMTVLEAGISEEGAGTVGLLWTEDK